MLTSRRTRTVLFVSTVVAVSRHVGLCYARANVVVSSISSWNADLSSTDRDVKYCKMARSAFLFFRGTNHLFWMDYAQDDRLSTFGNDPKTTTWLQGDLHVENYGTFENDKGNVIYAINDYDESMVADYQYDVWRMAISLSLFLDDQGETSSSFQEDVIDAFSESYLDFMSAYRSNNDEKNKKFTEDETYGELDNFIRKVENDESRAKMLGKWNKISAYGVREFDLSLEKLQHATQDKVDDISSSFPNYVSTTSLSDKGTGIGEYFYIKDVAKRILAGTGSLGRERYYVLIEGPSTSQDDDIILDVKLQSAPTPYHYLSLSLRNDYDDHFENHAQRHAVVYKALIDEADNHLGWIAISGNDFSVRERSPFKETFDATELSTKNRYQEMAAQWGAILATSHARRQGQQCLNCRPQCR